MTWCTWVRIWLGIKTTSVPVYARAMVLVEDTLFIAGPKHILTDQTAGDPQALAEQATRLQGTMGAELHAVSAQSGETSITSTRDAAPVFDGMIAADGKLYVSTMNNTLTCLGP